MHGKTSMIYHDGSDLFREISIPFEATRYHSLVVEKESVPDNLKIIAWTQEQEVMGLAHKILPVWGVQFHPESILTRDGKKILDNFRRLAEGSLLVKSP